MRYMPPNGTAGLARSAVNGIRRLPSPPARKEDLTHVVNQGHRQPAATGPTYDAGHTCPRRSPGRRRPEHLLGQGVWRGSSDAIEGTVGTGRGGHGAVVVRPAGRFGRAEPDAAAWADSS